MREIFDSLGVTVTIDFEKKQVGQRHIIPTHAEVRLGANGPLALPAATPQGEVEEQALGKDGRGDRRPPLLHETREALSSLLRASPFRAVWSKAQEMAGWRPLPRKRPPARHNGLTFQVRRKGYRTLGEVADASGVPNTTLRRWIDRGKLTAPPLLDGLMALPEAEYEAYVARCRALYLSAPKARNKKQVAESQDTSSRSASGQGV